MATSVDMPLDMPMDILRAISMDISMDISFDIFMEKRLEALAGVRPRLITDVERVPGAKILDGQFTAVQQAMGCTRGKEKAASYLKEFVEEMKASGFVAKAIKKHNVVGRLSVAALA